MHELYKVLNACRGQRASRLFAAPSAGPLASITHQYGHIRGTAGNCPVHQDRLSWAREGKMLHGRPVVVRAARRGGVGHASAGQGEGEGERERD